MMARTRVRWVPKDDVPRDGIRVFAVGEDGNPVSGALVGTCAYWCDMEHPFPGEKKGLQMYAPNRKRAIRTNASGAVVIRKKNLFHPGWPEGMQQDLFIIDPSQEVGAILKITPDQLGCEVTSRLSPLCHVSGLLTSKELDRLKRELGRTVTCVFSGKTFLGYCRSTHQRFGLLLPAGSYRLNAYGRETYHAAKTIRVRPGQKSASANLDLPAHRLAYLFGKTAPEFRRIKGWKNGEDVRLSDLKGKVVVLDFWGFWCGPCVHGMPALIQLHDKFKNRGLVIIAIHDDSLASTAELEEKCSQARKEIWGGRDLPFHVALDGGGECKVPGRDQRARGATTALYGINMFPTTLLIDKRGILVEQVLPYEREQTEKRIRELLKA